jgi:REP element-mobilizing transposase RayT
VVTDRHRIGEPAVLAKIHKTALRICNKKGYQASALAVLPDHLHLAFRGVIAQTPEEIALSFLNNLAHALDRRPWWQRGYYAGTFGEYSMAAVRRTYGKNWLSCGKTCEAHRFFDPCRLVRQVNEFER